MNQILLDAFACFSLIHTKLMDQAHILAKDVMAAISWLEDRGVVFDIIFMDPPYDKEIEKDVIYRLENSSICGENTIVVAEASLETDFSYVEDAGFRILKEKCYKSNKHVFLERIS